MPSLIKIVVAVLLGVLVGLLYTIQTLNKASGGVAAGAWHSALTDGASNIDPYTLAAVERASLLPLGTTEGLTFTASADNQGVRFDPACDYVVAGPMPPARYWTLSLLTPEGFPVADPAERYGFTSSEVLRDADKPVSITVSPKARSGNWLPTGDRRNYVLMLRLYDTSLSTAGTVIDSASMPSIKKSSCR